MLVDQPDERSRSLQNFYSCRWSCRCARTARSRSLQNFYSCRLLRDGRAYLGSRSLQNFYSCRYQFFPTVYHVPVLYKISTLVDRCSLTSRTSVPVLYKISTLVDFTPILLLLSSSRSLQNFYSCRCGQPATAARSSRSLQNFYSCRSKRARRAGFAFPFFTKFLLL